MSQSDRTESARKEKSKIEIEKYMTKMLSRTFRERILASYQMDMKIVVELLLKGQIRDETGHDWIVTLARYIDVVASGEVCGSPLFDVESKLICEVHSNGSGKAGTDFAISNSKGS